VNDTRVKSMSTHIFTAPSVVLLRLRPFDGGSDFVNRAVVGRKTLAASLRAPPPPPPPSERDLFDIASSLVLEQ
jgi:hypothetical protein